MRLRQALSGTGVHIRTEPDGYRTELGPGQLDLSAGRRGGASARLVVAGPPGVGKSAVALHAAPPARRPLPRQAAVRRLRRPPQPPEETVTATPPGRRLRRGAARRRPGRGPADPGRPAAGVAAELDASYVQLTAEQRHLLRLLGLVPDGRVTPEAAAVLTEQPVAVAAAGLDQLAEAGLLQRLADGGYRLHVLTRAFAVQRQAQEDDPDEIRAARRRLSEAGERPRDGFPRTALRRPTARRA
jgi:hypothetical protein